jgi:hypothetical protein
MAGGGMNFGSGMLNLIGVELAEFALASTALAEVECKGFSTGFQV